MAYQRKNLVPLADVGPPGDLPADLVGLTDESLADLEAAVGTDACAQLGYLNTGFFPVDGPIPAGDVTQMQFRVAAEGLGHFVVIDNTAEVVGGEKQIRWDSQVVLSETTDPWLVELVTVDAGLTAGDLEDIFVAARLVVDTLRTRLG